jgi:hypothetical protein
MNDGLRPQMDAFRTACQEMAALLTLDLHQLHFSTIVFEK